jgi:hypothetical protein
MPRDLWNVATGLPIPTGLEHSAQVCDLPRRSAAKAGEGANLGENEEP